AIFTGATGLETSMMSTPVPGQRPRHLPMKARFLKPPTSPWTPWLKGSSLSAPSSDTFLALRWARSAGAWLPRCSVTDLRPAPSNPVTDPARSPAGSSVTTPGSAAYAGAGSRTSQAINVSPTGLHVASLNLLVSRCAVRPVGCRFRLSLASAADMSMYDRALVRAHHSSTALCTNCWRHRRPRDSIDR